MKVFGFRGLHRSPGTQRLWFLIRKGVDGRAPEETINKKALRDALTRCGTLSQNGYGAQRVDQRKRTFLIFGKLCKENRPPFTTLTRVANGGHQYFTWVSLRIEVFPFWRKSTISNREEQIIGTQEKPQRIVVQRPLSRLQYLDSTKSSAKDLPLTPFNLWWVGSNLWRLVTDRWNQQKAISFQVTAQAMKNVA